MGVKNIDKPGREAYGILAPRPGIKPAPPSLEGEVLTTGLPGKYGPHPKKKNLREKKNKEYRQTWLQILAPIFSSS